MDRTIWQNIHLDIEDYRADLEEFYPGSSEDELYSIMYDYNTEDLECERINLDIKLDSDIICIGSLGLWDGTRHGYKSIGNNIKNCLYDESCDYIEWYCDNYDLRFKGYHHDGSNNYLYRQIRPELTERQLENFYDRLDKGLRKSDLKHYTKSLRPYIAKVYGW